MRESLYETLTILGETEEKQLLLVRHALSHVFYVKKVFAQPMDMSIYYQLMRNPHPNMAFILEAEQDEDGSMLIEEFVNGVTLEYAKSAKNLRIDRIQKIFLELFDVLEHLHAQQPPIVHRDIKPSNIMLEKGHVKLIDFEIARKVSEVKKKDTQIIGSVGYAAPEQYGFGQSDQRSDIYALGVLMKELLEGIQEAPAYQPVIDRCLEMDPDKRYQDIAQMREDFIKHAVPKLQKEKRKEVKMDFLIPGFAKEPLWQKVLYYVYYCIVLGSASNMYFKGAETQVMQTLERFAAIIVLVLIVWVPNNVGNILHTFPLYQSKYKGIRILNGVCIWALYSFIALIAFTFIGSFIEQIMKSM